LGIKEIITIFSPFWGAEAGAEGYILEVAYGLAQGANANPAATAEWDRLAVMTGTIFDHDVLNADKTYNYRVYAFNGAGLS